MFLSIRTFVHLHYEHTDLILSDQNLTIKNATQHTAAIARA